MNSPSRSWRASARALPVLLALLLAACGGGTATPLATTPPNTSGTAVTPTTGNAATTTATRGTATSTANTAATATRATSATPMVPIAATATRGTATPVAVSPTVPLPTLTVGPTPTTGPTPTVPGPPIPVLPTIALPTSAATGLPPATSGGSATGGGSAQPGRAISATNPLRVYMAGDSFAEWIGADLTSYGQRSGPVTTSTDGKISSGLANPAFFDWPARLTQAMATNKPDVVVIVLGANDLNGVSGSGGYFANGTPGWFTEYGRRQGQIMDIVGQSGAQLYWLAQPPMRDPGQNAAAYAVNQSALAQIISRPWVHYVDTWALFSDANGNFATTVIGADGQPITARQSDGLHLSREGATLLAASAYAQIRRDWGLP
jgi:lysophospholipase L1-like esterase